MNTSLNIAAQRAKREHANQVKAPPGPSMPDEATTPFTEMHAALWMAARRTESDPSKLGLTTKLIREQWLLLGDQMAPALAEMQLQLQDPQTAGRLVKVVENGATVGELASYFLAPRGEIGLTQNKHMRAMEDRMHEANQRGTGENITTLGIMVGIPTAVVAVGIPVATLMMAIPMLGIAGTIAFLSTPLAFLSGAFSITTAPITVVNLLKKKRQYENLRIKVPDIKVSDSNEPPLDGELIAKLNAELSKIPHADWHLFKHLGPKDTQIFLQGGDEVRRNILETNPPSQNARMEADISAMDKTGWQGFYRFIGNSVNSGFKTSKPDTVDGGIDKLQEKLEQWRAGGAAELPGRRRMLPK